MAKITVDSFWTRYMKDDGDLHREDGPAAISSSGEMCWFLDNDYNRENGPARDIPNGLKYWAKGGWTVWPKLK